MTRNLFVVTVLLLLATSASMAAELKSEDDSRRLADGIMASVAAGDMKAAFDKMKPHLSISETEVDSVLLQTKTAREQYRERFGDALGYEYISTKKIGKSLIGHLYVEKTRKTAFAWKFVFYKAEGKWVLITFNWGDASKEFSWD